MSDEELQSKAPGALWLICEIALLLMLFFVYAGDHAPMVNEAHYLVKAKNFWDDTWCANDLFAASGKAHTTFYLTFGWLTKLTSFSVAAWIGRWVGWLLLAVGLQRLSWCLLPYPLASLGVATIWIAGIEYGNLAGEWVVGGIEAKVPAYGFVLMALAKLAQRQWNHVWPLLGLASAFHVLSGGWSVLAATLVWWMTERKRDDAVPFFSRWLFLGGAISLLGLVPALWLTSGVSAQDSAHAAMIYTYVRIRHHLLPYDLDLWWYARHGALVAATLWLMQWTLIRDSIPDRDDWNRIRWFTLGAVLIAAVGLLIGFLPTYAPALAAKLLRYYWFRLTDAIVPLAFALLVIRWVCDTTAFSPKLRLVGAVVLTVSIALVANSSYLRGNMGIPPSASHRLIGYMPNAPVQQQRQSFKDWLAVCHWARSATPRDEIFLTPRHQQTFKWYAHRAEVVNWKDVPQDAESLKEWYRRFRHVFPRRATRVTIRYESLRAFRDQYGVRFMIVDRRIAGPNLPLVKLYPLDPEENGTYAVYELPYD